MAVINTFLDPTIILDEMAINATVAEDNAADANFTEVVGKYFPIIQINTFLLEANYLQSFRLSSEGFIPELEFSFVDNAQLFKAAFYPKDGDLISVYIKSHEDDTFKPIRIDFDILSFTDLGGNEFSVRGVMNVPLISAEICRAYPELSSHELLQTLAEELTIGFASNEDATADLMNWINAYNSYDKFIQDSTLRIYKDDRSFYTSFIDFYYYLNLVNVNKQFEEYETETTTVRGISAKSMTISDESDSSDESGNNEIDLFLTNHPTYGGTNIGIVDYQIINESGTVWKANGYKRFAQFFDLNDNQYYSFFVDPITTEGAEKNSVLMKGRPGDLIYEDIQKYKYLGTQLTPAPGGEDDSGESSESSEGEEKTPPRPEGSNVHRNYQFAMVQNIQNNEELKKITIKATLPTVNSSIYRYQTIPLIFYETDVNIINTLKTRDLEVDGVNEDEGDTENFEDLKVNTLLSGLYVVQSIAFVWDEFSNNVKQELVFTRREWPIQLPKEFESRNPRKTG